MLVLCAGTVYAEDTDKDGIDDRIDNCLNLANPDQRDTDLDGVGNLCDGDLNNDGIVNNNDLGVLAASFGRKAGDLRFNPNADLDGNNVVNNNDLGRFGKLFGRKPGPSAIKGNPEFVIAPPPVRSVQLMTLDKPLPDGRDAAAIMRIPGTHEAELALRGRSTILFAPFGAAVTLNDLGIEPDLEAKDGVFSAFLKADLGAVTADAKLLEARLGRLKGDAVTMDFSGRRLAGTRGFDLSGARKIAVGDDIFEPLRLPSGRVLRPLPFEFVPPAFFPANIVSRNHSLVVRSLGVVADPTRTFDPCDTDGDGNFGNVNGPWSFATLMGNMANTPATGVTAQAFVHAWLKKWLADETVNGDLIRKRDLGMRNEVLSQIVGWNDNDPSTLDLSTVPFRLLAIVNRMDLAKATVYGPGEAGETRFVFGLLTGRGTRACGPHPQGMSVIFEYGDVQSSCVSLKQRAQAWIDLDAHSLGSAAYNTALQALTDSVTLPNAAPAKPNGSAVNQVRTNDVALNFPWQFREFRLTPGSPHLRHHVLANTPQDLLNGGPRVRDFINANEFSGTPLPGEFPPGTPFLAGKADYQPGTHVLGAPVVSKNTARQHFSLQTCGGCHAAEALDPTVTIGQLGLAGWGAFAGIPESFYHVDARTPAGLPARLSRFMVGTSSNAPFSAIPEPAAGLPDSGYCSLDDRQPCSFAANNCPAGKGVCKIDRHFDDLSRRAQLMQELASSSCFFRPRGPGFRAMPFPFVH